MAQRAAAIGILCGFALLLGILAGMGKLDATTIALVAAVTPAVLLPLMESKKHRSATVACRRKSRM